MGRKRDAYRGDCSLVEFGFEGEWSRPRGGCDLSPTDRTLTVRAVLGTGLNRDMAEAMAIAKNRILAAEGVRGRAFDVVVDAGMPLEVGMVLEQ